VKNPKHVQLRKCKAAGVGDVTWCEKPFCKATSIGNVACYMTALLQRRAAAAGGLNSEMETHVRLTAGSVP